MRRWLLGRYIRWGTKRARWTSRYRLLTTYCDYEPAHFRVRWVAVVDGVRYGQSCTRHVGALLVDAQRKGEARIEPVEPEPSRMNR